MPLCPSPGQSAVSECGWSSTSCAGVSTPEVDHPYFSGDFGAVEIGEFMNPGWDPIFFCVRWKYPLLYGFYPLRTALQSSNQSPAIQRDWGFLTVQGGIDPIKICLLPRS